ncbi:MAG TPA: hypothetical protein VER33_28535 [Polyangiaceae bacterium]|nr:hypothetical protein [Polyangiaceae bacterium]
MDTLFDEGSLPADDLQTSPHGEHTLQVLLERSDRRPCMKNRL